MLRPNIGQLGTFAQVAAWAQALQVVRAVTTAAHQWDDMVGMEFLLSALKKLGMAVRAQAALSVEDSGNVCGGVDAFGVAPACASVAGLGCYLVGVCSAAISGREAKGLNMAITWALSSLVREKGVAAG